MALKSSRYHEAKTRQPVKFVYFDIGNVLVRFYGAIEQLAHILHAAANDVYIFWSKQDPNLNRGTLLPQEFWKQLKNHYHYHESDIDFAAFWAQHLSPIPETHALAHSLVRRLSVGLLTNIPPRVLDRALAHGHLPSIRYAAIIESHKFGLIKPEPKIFRIAQRQAGVKPEEILFIDDNATYIDQAILLGFNTYHFDPDNPAASVKELSQRLLR